MSTCLTEPHPATPQATLIGQIASQAEATPQALAISAADARLTYRDLAKHSDRLAQRLQSIGAGPGARAAICMPQSGAFIVSCLAALKAACAYVPLDPAHPIERLIFALHDCEAAVLLGDAATTSRLQNAPCPVLTIDCSVQPAEPDQSVPLTTPGAQESTAYVIYTSGSTGQQKGVEISHANLRNLVDWHLRRFGVTARDRATQIASPAFDAAVWEIWPYLAVGASLHIPDHETRCSPEALRDWLVQEKISISFIPTVLAERMIQLPWPPESALRILLTGGDTLHHYPPSSLPFVLVNNYGPTEATVVTTSTITVPNDKAVHLPPIGTPIDNCQVHVLDESMIPVNPGEAGELYIGGASVARGYLNRPELTRERFIPDRFSKDPTARLYRSGDRVQLLPSGELLFLGRCDEQIKIRGYRIEPQEIISAINAHPAVQDSIITVGEDAANEKCMIAYVVTENPNLTRSELAEFLNSRLPEYMIPAVFVRMDALPITSNGKVNRAALPTPAPENLLPDRISSTPSSAVAEKITAIVCELLGIEQVGADENFFLLGGHSLLGTQVIAKIRDAFSVELPLRTIFEQPTIAGLSSEVEQRFLERLDAMSDREAGLLLDESSAA